MEFATIFAFVDSFVKNGYPRLVARDPIIQFGTEDLPLKMARFLPVVQTDSNTVYEEVIRIGAGFIANDGSPLSPPQIKQVGSSGLGVTYQLGHLDIASQMTAKEMNELGKLLNSGTDRSLAEQFVSNWITDRLRLAIEKKTEVQRLEALINGQVTISPMDGAPYTVTFPVPPAHRVTVPSGTVAAPAGWYADDYNPIFENLLPAQTVLKDLGYDIIAQITSNRIMNVLQTNKEIALNGAASFVFDANGTIRNVARQQSIAAVNAQMQAQGLPAVEAYDEFYEHQDGSRVRFFPEDKFIMIGRTNRDQVLDLTDYKTRVLKRELIRNTLGYVGEGISLGNQTPGMTITLKTSDLKPVGIYGEGYVERFPIFMDYDAVFVFTIPKPTP